MGFCFLFCFFKMNQEPRGELLNWPHASGFSLHHIRTYMHRRSQGWKPHVIFTGLKNCWHHCSISEKEDPLATTKGLSFQAYVLLLRITFFITLKVLSFSPDFKNKVNPQMTGYNLEEGGKKSHPPRIVSKSVSCSEKLRAGFTNALKTSC